MAGPIWTTVQVALFGSSLEFFASWSSRDVACARRKRFEDRIEMSNYLSLTADHHAVASLQPPHTAARANVNVMDALRRQFPGAANVVDVIRIPAVNEDVSFVEQRQKIFDGFVHYGCRDH